MLAKAVVLAARLMAGIAGYGEMKEQAMRVDTAAADAKRRRHMREVQRSR